MSEMGFGQRQFPSKAPAPQQSAPVRATTAHANITYPRGSDKGAALWAIEAAAAKVRHYCDRGATLLRQRCDIERPPYLIV